MQLKEGFAQGTIPTRTRNGSLCAYLYFKLTLLGCSVINLITFFNGLTALF